MRGKDTGRDRLPNSRTGRHQELQRQEGWSPPAFGRSLALLAPSSETSGLQDCEGMFVLFVLPGLCWFVTAASGD